jgi:hypothetical protein
MGSFTGDILRLLAHQGLQTGGQLLGNALAIPMKSKADIQEYSAKQNWEALKTASPEQALSVAARLKELAGGKDVVAMAPTGKVLGPTGERLAMTPMPGAPVTPEMGVVQPPISAEQALGGYFQRNPKAMDAYVGLKTGATETLAQQHADEKRGLMIQNKQIQDEANNLLKQQGLAHQEYKIGMLGELGQAKNEIAIAKMQQLMQEFDHRKALGTLTEADKDQQQYLIRLREARDKATSDKIDPKMAVIEGDAHNALLREARDKHPKAFAGMPEIPIAPKDVSAFGGIFGSKMERRIDPNAVPSVGAPAAASSSGGVPKGIPKTGTVQSGPNAGKRKLVYPDGTVLYEDIK